MHARPAPDQRQEDEFRWLALAGTDHCSRRRRGSKQSLHIDTPAKGRLSATERERMQSRASRSKARLQLAHNVLRSSNHATTNIKI